MKTYKRKLKLKDKYKNLILLIFIYIVLMSMLLFYIKRIEKITNNTAESISIKEILKK